MAEYERLCAVISSINDIISSEYKEMPGWEPNYIKLHSRVKASRFNIIGTIIDLNISNPITLTIDDGTGQLEVRSFDDIPFSPTIGETILVVGKPRKYNDRLYLNSEIVRKIDDNAWINHRKKLIEILKKHYSKMPVLKEENVSSSENNSYNNPFDSEPENNNIKPSNSEEKVNTIKNKEEKVIEESNDDEKNIELTDSEKIYNMINELDQGDGAQISFILERCEKEGIKNAERSIQLMLEMGDIFEIKSGRVKIL